MSPSLAEAIQRFERFLVSDDLGRSDAIAEADSETLSALVEAVTPLFNEINSVLDDLVGRPHPLPADQEMLECRLNALGQVGMEAQLCQWHRDRLPRRAGCEGAWELPRAVGFVVAARSEGDER